MNKVLNKKVLLSILIINVFSAYAQIRDLVGVVRPDINPQVVTFLKDFQSELKAKSYTSYANEIDNYLAGSFGSGFIYVDADGNNYVVTNRHVVGESKTASIEFENPETGAVTKFENLTIAAFDDEIDVAILSFASGAKPFKKGLSFAAEKVTDGMEVYSAGFPGLGGKPLWQFGKGTVTNSSARIKELINPEISVLIQHSAEVDAGNSGGPLLISSKTEAGYAVVGVNTWKANYRQNTNFAIPGKVIADFIVSGKSPTEEERSEKIEAILKNPDSEYTEIAKYISLDTVYEKGSAAFIDVLKYAPTAVRNTVNAVYSQSPVEAMKYAIAYEIKNGRTPAKDKTPDYSSKKKSEIVKFMGIESASLADLFVGPAFTFGDSDLGAGLSAGINVWPYACIGLEANAIYFFKDGLSVINFGPAVRLPLSFNRFYVNPFAKVEAGLTLNGEERYTQAKLEGGAEVLFNGKDVGKWGVGLSYSYFKFKEFGNATQGNKLNDQSVSGVSVYGKVSF